MHRHYFRLKKLNGKKLRVVKSFFFFFMIKPLLANHHVWDSNDFHERIPSISFSLQKCKDQKYWECSHSLIAVATFHIPALEQHTGSWIMTFSGFVINTDTAVLISCFFKRCLCFIFSYVSVHMNVLREDGGVRSLRTGVPYGCEPSDIGVG